MYDSDKYLEIYIYIYIRMCALGKSVIFFQHYGLSCVFKR